MNRDLLIARVCLALFIVYVMTFIVWLNGCSRHLELANGAARLVIEERVLPLGEWTTTATLSREGRAVVVDSRRKETLGGLGAAVVGATVGILAVP